MPPDPSDERYNPLALISVVLIALLGFAVFFLSFLVAPLAILLIFYLGFAASDRSKRNGNAPPPPPAAVAAYPGTVADVEEAPRMAAGPTRAALARQRAAAEIARAQPPG